MRWAYPIEDPQEEFDDLLIEVHREYPGLPQVSGQDPAGLLLLAEVINSVGDYRYKARLFVAAVYAGAWWEWDNREGVYHFFTGRSGMVGAHDPYDEIWRALVELQDVVDCWSSELAPWNGVVRQPEAEDVLVAYAAGEVHPLVPATSEPDCVRDWYAARSTDKVEAVAALLRSASFYREDKP